MTLYFAYGSNMDVERLKARVGDVTVVGIATRRDTTFASTSGASTEAEKRTSLKVPTVKWRVLYSI